MIVFHEGLPGCGKSYEACLEHILPALKNGRTVITNINGINHDKFSQVTGVPLPIVKLLLIAITHPDCDTEEERLEAVKADVLAFTKKDSLVVLDEIQDMFPNGRKPLSSDWSKYIASHRHEGLDIILMGQDRRDVHAMWRRRIERLFKFNKLTAVGSAKRYQWICLQATSAEKFAEVSRGVRSYDKQYFGLYASHTEGTNNKSVYVDDRGNVWKNKQLRFYAVAFVVLAWFGISHLVSFFKHGEQPVKTTSVPRVNSDPVAHSVSNPVPASIQKPLVSEPTPEDSSQQPAVDIFDQEAKKGRLRLAALVQAADQSKVFFRVEIIDGYGRLYATYDRQSLLDLGWRVDLHSYGVSLSKDGAAYVVRPWALDRAIGQVNQRSVDSFKR